jgi:hypothetical protein
MSDALITKFLLKCARYCPFFALDGDLNLTTSDSRKTADYFIFNRLAAIAKAYLAYEDPGLKKRIDGSVMTDDMQQEALVWQFSRVAGKLSERRIPAVIVKGPSLQPVYPLAGLRPFGDIDLYIKPSLVIPIVECFKEMGYELAVKWRANMVDIRSELKMTLPDSKLGFDIHWDLKGTPAIRKGIHFDLDDLNSELVPFPLGDGQIRQFAPELALVYLVSHHVLHHMYCGLIWLLDVLLLLEATPQFDWHKMQYFTRRIGLQRPLHFYLGAIKAFELGSIPEEVLSGIKPKSMRYHLAAASFPPELIFHSETKINRLRRKILREAFKYYPSSKLYSLKKRMQKIMGSESLPNR